MTNQLTNIMPRIVARGMLRFRETAILPRLVNSSFSAEAAQHGDVINVPISVPIDAADVTPGTTDENVPDTRPNVVSVPLNNWKRAAFYLNDNEMMQIEAQNSFIPLQMSEAINALALAVNTSIINLHTQIDHSIGTAGTPAFVLNLQNNTDVQHNAGMAIALRKRLNEAAAPKTGRFAVIDYETEANALALPQFSDAEKSGSTSVPLEGEIGRKFGIDWYSSDLIPHHENTIGEKTTVGDTESGADEIVISGAATGIERGAVLTIGAIDYVIAAAVSNDGGSTSTLTLNKGLHAEVADGTNVTFKTDFRVGLAMHRDAVALAMRPLTSGGMELGANGHMMSVTDPQTGLSLRLEVRREYKRTVWEFDVLWGVALVRPELAVKLYA